MHQSRDEIIFGSVTIVVHPLNQRRGTIANSDYSHINLTQVLNSFP